MDIEYKPRSCSSGLAIKDCELCGDGLTEMLRLEGDAYRLVYAPGIEEICFGEEGEKRVVCMDCSFRLAGVPQKVREGWKVIHISELDWIARELDWNDDISREATVVLDKCWTEDDEKKDGKIEEG